MNQSDSDTGAKIAGAVSMLRKVYRECHAMLDEIKGAVGCLKGGIEATPWLTWEPTDGENPDSCIRARLAQWYVPTGALVQGKSEDEDSEQAAKHHIRLKKAKGLLLFASIEMFNPEHEQALARPKLMCGHVSQFAGGFVGKGGDVLIHRGDLGALLASSDPSLVATTQPVHGRVRTMKATMYLRVWSLLAAVKKGADIEGLAKALVRAYKDPASLESVP